MGRDPEILFLQRLALTAASTATMGDLVRLVIGETTEALATDVCSVYLVDPDDGRLVLTATNGLSHEGVGRVRLALGEGVTGWAAAERRPVVVPDVREEPRFRWLDGVDQARFVSMCSVPIVAADRLVGVLNVQTDRARDFSPADVGFLSAIAAQVAGVLERGELQERLERRVAELRRSEEVHRRLSELVLAGAGLGAICSAIARLAGSAAAVYDPDGERVAAGGDGMPERLTGFVDPERRDDGLSVTPVRAGRDPLGWLAVAPSPGDDDLGRRQAIEHGATVLALELLRERAAADAERRLRGDLLDELLSARLRPEEAQRLADRAARLGHRLRGPAWVIVLEADDDRAGGALASPAARARLARGVGDLIAHRGVQGLVVERGSGVVLLATGLDELADAERIAGEARELAQALARGAPVSCGVSSEAGGPALLHRLNGEARHALRVARRMGEHGVVASYRRLGIERLLLEIDRPERLDAYVEDWVGPLARHDAGGKAAAPLTETLDALVREGWNMRAAARRLNVHVNTLLYRVGRIEQLVGHRLDDPDVRLAMAIALRARAIAGGSYGSSERPPAESRTARTYAPATPLPSLRSVPTARTT
jgi:sugar diacid utilization regulator/putative methionine-R-sulfoxide reductase with GAF domain